MNDSDYGTEYGQVVSVYTCPDCGRDLRLEWRDGMHHTVFGLACPTGHFGFPIELRGDPAAIDEQATKRQTDRCLICMEEVLDWDGEPASERGDPLHEGECAEEYRRTIKRISGGGD